MKLRLTFEVAANLDPNRETSPFFDVYLTSDVRSPTAEGVLVSGDGAISPGVGTRSPGDATTADSEVVASARYQERMVAVASGDRERPRSAVGRMSEDRSGGLAEHRARMVADLSVCRTTDVARDAAVCVHAFCEVECDDEARGSHTCGWAGATLSGLSAVAAAGGRSATLKLRDPGQSPEGTRGTVAISFDDATASQLASISYAPRPEFDDASELMSAYDAAATEIFSKIQPTSSDIRMFRLPMYSTCGGSISRPPCAFLLAERTARFGEEYYLRALDCVLGRRMRAMPSEARITEFVRSMSADERGAVLMDVAMFFPTACTYLFDEVLSRDGKRLVTGEEFSHLASTTICADCEDLAFFAAMVLRDIASRAWKSEAIRELRRTRLRYVSTISLKAVTRYSAAGSSSARRGFAAHDCCDLVPIVRLADMIRASGSDPGPISEIAAERGIDASENRRLSVIVGEGTGRVIEFPRPGNPATSPGGAKKAAAGLFHAAGAPSACTAIAEDSRSGSEFYRHAVSGIIHDTLDRPRGKWPIPQVVYAVSGSSGMTSGAPHEAYVKCECVAIPVVPPTDRQFAAMRYLEKFEHPITQVDPPSRDSAAFAAISGAAEESVRRCAAIRHPRTGAISVEVFVSLWELRDPVMARIEGALSRSERISATGISFERVADGLAFAVFSLSVSP